MTLTTQQQRETLDYFTRHAVDWHRTAVSTLPEQVNIIRQRNDFVLNVIARRQHTRAALDVGCGSGDLVCAIARQGIPATGVDFSDDMIRIAEENARQESLENAKFCHCSIFDFQPAEEQIDIISANGFIEYISHVELIKFIELCSSLLPEGGSLVVGSRNRLFNISSLNAFTEAEQRDGTINALLGEALCIASGAGVEELLTLALAPVQPTNTAHARTGVEVTTRFQYTPAQLVQSLAQSGFATQQIYPAHIHGVPPAFAKLHPLVHTAIANLLQQFAHDAMSLVPFASTFILHAIKSS